MNNEKINNFSQFDKHPREASPWVLHICAPERALTSKLSDLWGKLIPEKPY